MLFVYLLLLATALLLPIGIAINTISYFMSKSSWHPRVVDNGEEIFVTCTSAVGFIRFCGTEFRFRYSIRDSLILLIGVTLVVSGLWLSLRSGFPGNSDHQDLQRESEPQ